MHTNTRMSLPANEPEHDCARRPNERGWLEETSSSDGKQSAVGGEIPVAKPKNHKHALGVHNSGNRADAAHAIRTAADAAQHWRSLSCSPRSSASTTGGRWLRDPGR